jgi:hypothetical protein
VAELVDARDLKFSALFEGPDLFWKTRPPITIETGGTKHDLENRFRAGFRDPVLAVTSPARLNAAPELPTAAELGFSGMTFDRAPITSDPHG